MTVSGIELELQEVSEVQQKKREDRQTYLTRLMRAVSKVEDDIWGSLSKDAQDWNNEAATAFKEGRDIDDFPVEGEEPQGEETPVEAPEDDEEAIEDFSDEENADSGPEDETEQEPEADLGPEEVPEEPVVPKRRGRPPASTKPVESPHQPGMRTKVRGKNTSACHTIKRMVVKKPHITVDEITTKLKAMDLKVTPVTISTLRSSVRDTLRVLNEEGLGTFKLNAHSAD